MQRPGHTGRKALATKKIQWLGVKAKVEKPLSGTGVNVRQTTLRIENLPESWPMDTESAWRERYCKETSLFRTLLHICRRIVLPTIYLKDMKIQKLSVGWQYSMNFGSKEILITPTSGKEIQFLSCHPNPGTKSHSNSWRISSALREAKVNF